MKTCWFLPAFLIILLAGCATNHPTVGAWRGTGFHPARTDQIALTSRPDPSAEDAELGRVLVAELKREGFKLVPAAEADYTLAYVLEDDSTATYMPQHDFVVATPAQTSQDLAASATPPPPGFSRPQAGLTPASSLGSTVVVYSNKGIRLYLYTNPQTHPGGLQLAWSGCIEAGQRVPAEREPVLIAKLLTYFGQDYHGTVDLEK